MKRTIRFAVALCVLAATPARSEDAPPRVTLGEALRLAREHNSDLLAARADLDTAAAQRTAALAVPNPVLSYLTAKIPTDGTGGGTFYGNGFYSRSYDTIVSLGQLVEVGGKRKDRRVSADEGISGSRARLADAERLLDTAVVRAYAAAAVAETSAALARETAASFDRTAAIAGAREREGDISVSERMQIEIAYGRFLADAAQADLAAANARRALAALLNLPAVTLADGLGALAPPDPGDSIRSADDATLLERRPDVLALAAAVRKTDADLALQKAYRIPDPTLQAQYEREPPDQRNTVGFGVSLPLPVFNHNAGAIRAAEIAVESARRDLSRGRMHARQDLDATRDALEAAQTRAGRLSDELLPKAEKVRDTVHEAYEQGASSLLELLEAERNANDIQLAAASARGDLAAARADFLAARRAADKDQP